MPHFTFVNDPVSDFQRDLHRLWEKYYIYKHLSTKNVRLMKGTQCNKSLYLLLIEKKRSREILTNSVCSRNKCEQHSSNSYMTHNVF
jgi:hypothetical protein